MVVVRATAGQVEQFAVASDPMRISRCNLVLAHAKCGENTVIHTPGGRGTAGQHGAVSANSVTVAGDGTERAAPPLQQRDTL